jgi:hypothetical protein
VAEATARELDRGGVEVAFRLTNPLGTVTRRVAAYPGIAGFATQTEVALPGVLTGYTLDEITLPGAAPTAHAFAAGYDWRGSDTPDWEPGFAPFGGAHTGDHRETTTAPPGASLAGEGQWLSLATPESGARAFVVLERNDYASSQVAYDGTAGRALVDLDADAVYLGPFESDVHLANPGAPARFRTVRPDTALTLERVFTGLAVDADDEPWQHYRYLVGHRAPRFERAVTFNSNGVDTNRISTGAKDDMDLAEVRRQAAVARRLGVETFILDDGWQAVSGDWCPDSPQCPEPRAPRFPARFPDATFAAVREELGDMELGLWMSPMHFNPASQMARRNPGWICQPLGAGTTAANAVSPDSGSNEAGIGCSTHSASARTVA